MGMGTLNVWVSEIGDPCGLTDRTWYVTIYDCDGDVFQWCGKRYVVMPAPCGHLEVDLPPGCYYVKASWNYWQVGSNYRANHFTDPAIVQVCCGETTCVKIFAPEAHRCGWIFLKAVEDLARQKLIRPAIAKEAEGAIRAVIEQLPQPLKPFELGHLDEIDALLREQGQDDQFVEAED